MKKTSSLIGIHPYVREPDLVPSLNMIRIRKTGSIDPDPVSILVQGSATKDGGAMAKTTGKMR